MQYENPLIVQGDRTILLDVHAPLANECRNELIPFAELERSPEHLHTYRLTPLSLWNAASAGFTAEDAVSVLKKYAKYDIPQSVCVWIKEVSDRFGMVRIIPGPKEVVPLSGDFFSEEQKKVVPEQYLYLVVKNEKIFLELGAIKSFQTLLTPCKIDFSVPSLPQDLTENEKKFSFILKLTDRGTVKQLLLKYMWPCKDEVPLEDGESLQINLRDVTKSGKKFEIRGYQKDAAQALIGDKGPGTGFGTIVLPCGAGKTIVGMQIMQMLKTNTLIITTNISAVHQWINELLDKTDLQAEQIAEYTGESKTIKPVTVATYQILTWRPEKDGPYPHFSIFRERKWGLIIYDEVHTLPAPVFRVAAELQTVRRVGLTATLVREDGLEGFVFSLVGPKRFDVPWKELEHSGWISEAECVEVRLDLPSDKEIQYAVASQREKYRIASENPVKDSVVLQLVNRLSEDKILVIGQYLSQLEKLSSLLSAPIITGKTPNSERDRIYNQFRNGEIKVLVVSKVANFAIDLPDASVAIQVSGTFGSRQEEAQRLGRILRPKDRTSRFFTLITRNTVEEEFGSNRQKFLAEQGYSYKIIQYKDESSFQSLECARLAESESQ
ncbi:MAG: DEAD/DEAH box helicase [Spirochaetia bacterium]|nr:DEAD/DEAH box helicase [Spirochaetia bacterium]MCI6827208.1 DEAD/DEAH box helicase [Spirochaetia bacterium]MCI7800028.1 DEAD/DEAH box helicase [Spirochaetia bacterium]